MYSIKLYKLKWLSFVPEVNPATGEGVLRILADADAPNIVDMLPPYSKFYLSPTIENGGEDKTIVRTCTSAYFDETNNQNIFEFTPAPSTTWTSTAFVVKHLSTQQVTYTGYTTMSSTGVPTPMQIEATINDNLAN